MQTTGNTILITGGSSGIGLAAAEMLARAGNEVLICGRRESKLAAAQRQIPPLHTLACDVSVRAERERLVHWATSQFGTLNILINNAGIQRETDFLAGAPELTDGESEIDTNLTASVHLAGLCIPHFLKLEKECAVVNVTSGLAFIPLRIVPVYCATKAALHSFSMSLRSQLEQTNVRVFEIIPPLVQTDLHRGPQARRQAQRAILPSRVAEALVRALEKEKYEVTVGQGRDLKVASRIAPHFFHRLLNKLVES
jgi:uncharacterized oxidoreductase